jgi:hypothetical protein
MFEVTTGSYEDHTVVGYATDEDAAYALLGRHIVTRSDEHPGSITITEPMVRELSESELARMRALLAPLFATHDIV